MADVESNIHVNIDTSDALASLKLLQRQISAFHTQMAKSGTAASAVAANQAQNLMNSINATGQFQASMRNVTTSTEQFTDSLERNKLTSREYFRYTGAATKTFGKLFKSEFETINKVARERVKDIQTQYVKLGRGANGALQAIAVRPLTLDMKNLGTQTAIAAQRQQLLNQLLKQGSTNLLNFGKNTQWAGRQLMVGFTVPLAMLGTTAAKTFMQMEEQAIRFKRVYGELFTTQEETDAMIKQIQTLAKEYTKYGVAVEDTMKMAADAAAMGKQGAALMAQVAQATRLAVLGGVEQEQALETTISVTNAFGVATEDLAKKIDFLNAVENQTVVSIEDLTIAIPKAGPVVQQLGGDVEDLAFFLTAMKEGGINASEGANALKSGLASLINPSKKASAFLADLGVNITGIVEANKGDIKATVVGFAQALDTLDPLNRARAIEQLFGKFQFSRLSTLFQNVTAQGTQANRVLQLTQATTEELAILSQRELDKIQNTTTYKFKKSMEDLKVAIAPVGEQFLKALTPIVEFVGKILDKFNNLGEGSKKFLTIFTVAVAGIGPVLLMTFGLIANAVANIIKMFASMKSMYNRTGGASKVLGEQTNYLTKEQLEASAVSASLDQVHQKLQQTFTSEAGALNNLANAYRRAIAAQMGFAGPAGGPKSRGLKKYSRGTTQVPGSGNQDTVPTMLTPGEAVIPAKAAQDPANRPMIAQLVAGRRVQGFNEGTTGVTQSGMSQKTHVGGKSEQKLISDIIKNNPFMSDDQKSKLRALEAILVSQGLKATTSTLHKLMFTFPAEMNMAMKAAGGVDPQKFIDAWEKQGPDKWGASKINAAVAEPFDKAMIDIIKKDFADGKIKGVNDDYISKIFTERIPAERPDIAKSSVYKQAEKLYQTSTQFLLGKGLGNTPEESTRILEDAVKKGAIKSFTLTPREGTGKTNKGKIVTGSATVTLNDGTVVNMNRLGSGHRVNISQDEEGQKRGNAAAKRAAEKAKAADTQAKNIAKLKLISDEAARTQSGRLSPTNFGKQISPTTGFSFPVSGLGGLYEKPDGSRVFVKPMIDERGALAEQRATQIARDVHGLQAPQQTIRTMVDPTDKTGQRKIIVLESPYDPAFDPSKMSRGFTKEQYFKQLVAANLRIDKDLKAGNLGGSVIADVGAAGVFDKASGKRDFVKNLPSMEEMARINLSGVKGDSAARSPFWFGNATADIAKSMTADEYHRSMNAEIDRVLPKLEKTLATMDLSPEERPHYQAMVDRLRAGRKVNWRNLHKVHTSIAIKPDEVLQDDKTGKISKPKTKNLPSSVKSSGGKKDTRMTEEVPGKSIVQAPKRLGRTVIPGKADAPEARVSVAAGIVDGARGSIAEAKAVGANIGTTLSQSAAAASRTMLYGTGPVDAESKSLRRQLEKRQRAEAKTQAKINANKTAMYGTTGAIDPVMRGRRKQAQLQEKRSRLAEKVAYQQQIISERAAAEAKSKTVSGRITAFASKRADARQAKIDAGKRPGMGMGGALGIASGAAMIGSMAPGKVGEISQQVMMPLMGLAMILPMLKSPASAVAIGLTATVGAFVALRMAFDGAQKKVLEESDKFKGSANAINAIANFSGKVTASEQMDLRRKNSFSMLGPATGKTTYGEAFVQTAEGKALTARIAEQNAAGKGNLAAKDLGGQLSASIMSGAIDMDQAKSLALNAARQAGDMSIGVKVIGELESILGPKGERLEKEPLQVRLDMVTQNAKNMKTSADRAASGGDGFVGGDMVRNLAGQKTMQKVGIGASALGGAAAGAGIGGMIGGALGAVGGPLAVITAGIGATIGAGIGAAVGGIGAYFASKKFTKQAGTLGAAAAVDAKIAMEQNKQMLDSFDMYYQKKVEELRLQGKINEADALQTKYIKERDKLTAAQGKLQADVVSQYEGAGGLQESMMSGMKKAATARYKDDPNQLAYLDVVSQQAGNLRSDGLISKGQEYLIQAKMASGDIPPAVFRTLLGLAAENKDIAPKMMNIITKFSGATSESIGVAAQNILDAKGDVNKTVQTKFVTKVEAFEKDSDALDFTKNMIKLNNLNQVIPSDVLVSYYSDDSSESKAAYEKLNTALDGFEAAKTIDVPLVYKLLPEVQNSDMFNEEYFNSLKTDAEKRTYVNTITSVVNIPDPIIQASQDFIDWQKTPTTMIQGQKYGGAEYASLPIAMQIAHYKEDQGFKAVTEGISTDATIVPPGSGGGGGGSKVQSSPLDDLVKKLRDVRKNQIKVTEGWSASRKALDGLFGGKKTIDVFSGIENDLRGLGGNEDFIEFIVGMDPKEYEKRKNSLFKFDNKGNIIALKRDAKNIQEALNSITMGDWNTEMESELSTIEDQSIAFEKLSKLGVPVADAYELISDKARAQAIANGTNSKTLNTLIGQYKTLKIVQEASASIENAKRSTAQDKKDRLQEKRLQEIAKGKQFRRISASGPLDAFAIASDSELGNLENSINDMKAERERLLAKPKNTRSKAQNERIELLGDLLDDAEAAFTTRLTELKETVGLYRDMFDETYNNAMDSFDAEERSLQINFEINTKDASDAIQKAQDEIALIQYNVDDKEAALKEIEKQEQKINEKYDERIKALDEVEKANANISNQQKGQLTLAEALTSGDIAAAARAAQEMRAQEAANAVTKQKDAIEQSRQYELSRATGTDKMGSTNKDNWALKTRKQLEEEILNLQDKIFNKEEEIIEPQQESIRIKAMALKSDIDSIRVAGMSRQAWEKIQSDVELARVRAVDFANAIKSAIEYLKNGKLVIEKYGEQIKPTPEYSATPTPSGIPTKTPIPSGSPSASPSATPTATPSASPKPTTTPSATPSATPKVTATPSATPTATPSPTPKATTTPKATGEVYTVKPGDTLSEIASDNGVSLKELLEANPKFTTNPKYDDGNKIWSGTTVIIPEGGSVGAGKSSGSGGGFAMQYAAVGGLINPMRFAFGGFAKGTDTVPAMLTPGEFVMSKYAVDAHGVNTMKSINSGQPTGGTVYNNTYTLTVNAKTNASPNEIAQAVMSTIKQVDDRRIRGIGINGR
jgi:TP901 family phage tail tape measure protein